MIGNHIRPPRNVTLRTPVFSSLIAALLFAALLLPSAAFSQASQDDLYNQAVQDYTQNQFTSAQQKFQEISGSHSQAAQQYVTRIKNYKDAMSAAMSILDRSPDERDANSLQYAMQKFQEAIQIKPDGPWDPRQKLQQARELQAQILQKTAASTATRDHDFCNQAIGAQQEHRYREAALFICPVANDNPSYSCGGDEAVHMCEQMNDLAKYDKSPPAASTPPAGATRPDNSTDAVFEKAKAAYGKNDFLRALSFFRQVSGNSKASADEYADKISRYQDAMSQGNKLVQESKYEDAGSAFRTAVNIKGDGPGSPQVQALLMELMIGLDQFYAGDYSAATQHLEVYAHESSDRRPLVQFYLGASKLSRFFLAGGEDTNLRQDALNDLKAAKQAGFKAAAQDVSPKILQAYKDLVF